jgi:hypothetical protein
VNSGRSSKLRSVPSAIEGAHRLLTWSLAMMIAISNRYNVVAGRRFSRRSFRGPRVASFAIFGPSSYAVRPLALPTTGVLRCDQRSRSAQGRQRRSASSPMSTTPTAACCCRTANREPHEGDQRRHTGCSQEQLQPLAPQHLNYAVQEKGDRNREEACDHEHSAISSKKPSKSIWAIFVGPTPVCRLILMPT